MIETLIVAIIGIVIGVSILLMVVLSRSPLQNGPSAGESLTTSDTTTSDATTGSAETTGPPGTTTIPACVPSATQYTFNSPNVGNVTPFVGNTSPNTMAVLSDGSILLGGSLCTTDYILRASVVKIQPNFTIDSGFTSLDVIPSIPTFPVVAGSFVNTQGIFPQTDGTIIAGIFLYDGGATKTGMIFAKLLATGALDTSFTGLGGGYSDYIYVSSGSGSIFPQLMDDVTGSKLYIMYYSPTATLEVSTYFKTDGTLSTSFTIPALVTGTMENLLAIAPPTIGNTILILRDVALTSASAVVQVDMIDCTSESITATYSYNVTDSYVTAISMQVTNDKIYIVFIKGDQAETSDTLYIIKLSYAAATLTIDPTFGVAGIATYSLGTFGVSSYIASVELKENEQIIVPLNGFLTTTMTVARFNWDTGALIQFDNSSWGTLTNTIYSGNIKKSNVATGEYIVPFNQYPSIYPWISNTAYVTFTKRCY